MRIAGDPFSTVGGAARCEPLSDGYFLNFDGSSWKRRHNQRAYKPQDVLARHGSSAVTLPTTSAVAPTATPRLLQHVLPILRPAGLTEFLTDLDANDELELEIFCCLAEADLQAALDSVVVDEAPLGAIGKARIVKIVRDIFTANGFPAPALGGVVRSPPPAALAAPAATSSTLMPAVASLQDPTVELIAVNEVVDQTASAKARPLTVDEVAACRKRYLDVFHFPAPEEQTPSAEQLAGSRSIIAAGRVPYVDFSIWNPHGARLAKFRKTEASHIIGDTIVRRMIEASSGSLNFYKTGITQLHELFPEHWDLLITRDIIVRSEQWSRLREICIASPPPGFDHQHPWGTIIAFSSFGVDGLMSGWWNVKFVIPCTKTPSDKSAAKIIGRIEGEDAPGGSSSGGGGAQVEKERKRDRTPPENGREVCLNYNAGYGKCGQTNKCPYGRKHVCNVCGQPHRACDHHGKKAQAKAVTKKQGKR